MQFHVGNRRAAETGEFPVVVELRSDNNCQIRHTALEAARVISNSTIRNQAGAQGYALRVHTFHITYSGRINRRLVPVLTVFLKECDVLLERMLELLLALKRGQRVISIQVQPNHYLTARDALRKASMKFPTPCTIRLVKGHEHLKGLI